MALSVNERLADEARHRSIDFAQYSTNVARRLVALLNRSDAALTARLLDALDQVDATTFTVERLETLLTSVRELNASAYREVRARLDDEMRTAATTEAEFQTQLLRTVIPSEVAAEVGIAAVDLTQVVAAAMSRPWQGRLLAGWASKIEADRMAQIREAVRQGFVQGQTTDQIVRKIRGTRALKYSDGIINRGRVELQTVVHTALGHTAAVARDAVVQANSDIIAGVQWLSTLDNRTSSLCQIRDHLEYTTDHKPVGHKVPWLQGPGRLHFRCRSVSTPRTKSFRELGIDMESLAPISRASMDGQVSAKLSYGDWLRKQSAARQDEIVGPARGALMRSGGLPFDRLYTDRGEELTLARLKEREAAAFKRAGL